ncbi:MAG TPA: hypothetical protein VE913_17775 [Longimicrobium sp.]|nr:hypothetical protein [Longimicrobium sp.]
MLLGAHLTLMMGPMVALPVPLAISEALVGVEVTQSDRGRSGFQLQFQVGRSGPLDLVDFPLVAHPLMRPFTRVVIVVRFDLLPRVLMDGVITQLSLAPSEDPGASTLTVTGEDVSVMMDLLTIKTPWPGMPDPAIAAAILARYAAYGLVPMIIPPATMVTPIPTRTIPMQTGTDLEHLNTMAERYSHVFYVEPTNVPMVNKAYWGPPVRAGLPQKALSVNMGPGSNVNSISFQYNALSPTMVIDLIQDPETNVILPVVVPPVALQPPLALQPALIANNGIVRTSVLSQDDPPAATPAGTAQPATSATREHPAGVTYMQALIKAMATVQKSLDGTATASGELDALQYGDILRARGIVGVRGVGLTHDGSWYVQSVTHSIRKGEYKQRFTLNREGTHSLLPLVRP